MANIPPWNSTYTVALLPELFSRCIDLLFSPLKRESEGSVNTPFLQSATVSIVKEKNQREFLIFSKVHLQLWAVHAVSNQLITE